MNKLTFKQVIIYFLTIFILFGIPIYTIIINTNTLKDGTEYLFKVEAFDPYDMFRGNYLNINFQENSISADNVNIEGSNNNEYYFTIATDENGFAYFEDMSKTKPKDATNYFKTTARYISYSDKYIIDTPTRYYMNEDKAPMAEQIYNENIDNTYVKVRVKNGKMVIVGIYVNDILIDTID